VDDALEILSRPTSGYGLFSYPERILSVLDLEPGIGKLSSSGRVKKTHLMRLLRPDNLCQIAAMVFSNHPQ
jgi:hypothetical protein